MSATFVGDRSGTRIPRSGTSLIPVYDCDNCRDSGVVLARYIDPDDITATLAGRVYKWETCPVCKGATTEEEGT